MAILYPYTMAFLADLLDIDSVLFDVMRNDEVSGQGSGRIVAAELAPPLWYAEITLNPAYFEEGEIIAAKMRRLHGPMGTFMLYDPRKMYPAYDPTGSILGSRQITISGVGNDNDTLSLSGFPSGYKLTPGDKLAFAYGGEYLAFHEASDYVTANTAGNMTVQVFPHIAPGVVTDGTTEVTLKKPAARMALDADGWKPGKGQGLHTSGASIRAIQKV